MKLQRVICIEDTSTKYMDLYSFLQRKGISDVYHALNAEKGVEEIERAISEGRPYDLLLSDMHFDFYGQNDPEAGEKTMQLLRERGIAIPIIFCSSQNWKIPGSLGTIFYHEQRDWEQEAEELFRRWEFC